MKAAFFALATITVASQEAAAQELLIFGGDQFLGCLTCSEFDPDSVCNEFGAGSSFRPDGIFNEFGRYGNEFMMRSPWNEFSISDEVPILVDRNGDFYGYFTINEFRRDAFSFSGALKEVYDLANGDLSVVRDFLCN